VLAVAAAGLLAMIGAAAHDTSVRLPGTPLRFGTTLEQARRVIRMHAPPQVALPPPGPSAPGVITWQTGLRFFGLAGAATLEFADSVLVRASVVVNHPSPNDIDYVEDDLARQGFHRRCESRSGLNRQCEWTARARVTMSTSESSIQAVLEPLGKPPGPAPGAGGAIGAGAPAPPETLVLSLPPPTGAPAAPDALPWAVVLDSCQAIRPDLARQSGVFGRVLIEATVDTAGTVTAVRVARGVPMLDEAALACARRYRFAPCVWQGRAQPFRVALPIRFTR
jgi:TonB family protein